MNGEVDQLSRLVLYVKDIMRSGRVVDFKLEEYEKLSFIPKKKFLFSKVEECNDAQSWYKLLEKREIKDIHLVSYFEEDNIKFAGFSNSTEQGIVTEYANGKTTLWVAKWKFDEEIKGWTSYYKEFKWRGGSQYTYEECRRDFERTLLDIEELARLLGFDNFAKIFKEAYDILTSKGDSSIPEWARDDTPKRAARSFPCAPSSRQEYRSRPHGFDGPPPRQKARSRSSFPLRLPKSPRNMHPAPREHRRRPRTALCQSTGTAPARTAPYLSPPRRAGYSRYAARRDVPPPDCAYTAGYR